MGIHHCDKLLCDTTLLKLFNDNIDIMIPIKTLEIKMSSRIRTGIRKSMGLIDVMNFGDPLHGVIRSLESYLYEPLYNQILETYSEGYTAGGNLIRRHMPAGTILSAAALESAEDPRIVEETVDLMEGIEDSLARRESEIQAAIKYYIEQGATVSQITSNILHYFGDNSVAAERFARTATNDIYNRAHLDKYEASGVVDGVEYSAHIDRRTSDICRMLDGTIWVLGDSGIPVPPQHFNCLVAGTQIRTVTGMQDIESLQIKDMVLTHLNRYMPVSDVMTRVPWELIEIKTANRSIKVTPNHPIFIQRAEHREWVSAGNLEDGDDILILE